MTAMHKRSRVQLSHTGLQNVHRASCALIPLPLLQIGLDPDEPDMALFQAFYRWGKTRVFKWHRSAFASRAHCSWKAMLMIYYAGRMPVMEIVFLARKVKVEQNKLIQFNTVWGLPAQGAGRLVSRCWGTGAACVQGKTSVGVMPAQVRWPSSQRGQTKRL
jgi:hypothetical protein